MIEVEKTADHCLFHWKESALDATNCQVLKDAISANDVQGKPLMINLAVLEFIDSSGIGALISAQRTRGPEDGRVVLQNVAKPVREVLEMLHLHNVFTFA